MLSVNIMCPCNVLLYASVSYSKTTCNKFWFILEVRTDAVLTIISVVGLEAKFRENIYPFTHILKYIYHMTWLFSSG